MEGLVDHIQEQFRSTQELLFNRQPLLRKKTYQRGLWKQSYTSTQEQHYHSTCWEQPTHHSPWEQPSCPSLWEQPSRPFPWEQPSCSSHWEHPAEQSWSDTRESFEFQSPGNAATTLHKCPPLVVTSKVSSKALPSSVINFCMHNTPSFKVTVLYYFTEYTLPFNNYKPILQLHTQWYNVYLLC